MELKDIASVSGKSGLYKVVKPTRTGVILESLDAQRKKLVANANSRVSILKEISIYTTGVESSVLLETVLQSIFEKFGNELPVDHKASEDELRDFLEEVLPDYDEDRVYTNDIKKLVSWYLILLAEAPDLFEKEEENAESAESIISEEGTEDDSSAAS